MNELFYSYRSKPGWVTMTSLLLTRLHSCVVLLFICLFCVSLLVSTVTAVAESAQELSEQEYIQHQEALKLQQALASHDNELNKLEQAQRDGTYVPPKDTSSYGEAKVLEDERRAKARAAAERAALEQKNDKPRASNIYEHTHKEHPLVKPGQHELDFCRGCHTTMEAFHEFMMNKTSSQISAHAQLYNSDDAGNLNFDGMDEVIKSVCGEKLASPKWRTEYRHMCEAIFTHWADNVTSPWEGHMKVHDLLVGSEFSIKARNTVCKQIDACNAEDSMYGPIPDRRDNCGWCGRIATDMYVGLSRLKEVDRKVALDVANIGYCKTLKVRHYEGLIKMEDICAEDIMDDMDNVDKLVKRITGWHKLKLGQDQLILFQKFMCQSMSTHCKNKDVPATKWSIKIQTFHDFKKKLERAKKLRAEKFELEKEELEDGQKENKELKEIAQQTRGKHINKHRTTTMPPEGPPLDPAIARPPVAPAGPTAAADPDGSSRRTDL